ncbi:MAG: HAD-IIIC family phosphatase [Actinomycetes bacterium]
MTIDAGPRYRLSRFATATPIRDRVLLVDPVRLGRVVLEPEIAASCRQLREPMSAAEFSAVCPAGVDGDKILALLRIRGLVVPEGVNEESDLGGLLSDTARHPDDGAVTGVRYWQPTVFGAADFGGTGSDELRPLRVLLVGTCLLQFTEDALVARGLAGGFAVEVRHLWLDSMATVRATVTAWEPHLTVLAPTTMAIMSGLWDDGPLRPPRDRDRRVRSLSRLLANWVREFADALDGRLGLVHNFAPPAVSPFGRVEFRTPNNFRWVVAELNRGLDARVAEFPTLMVVDEERLAVRYGSGTLFDELMFPFAHHGGRADPAVETPHQIGPLSDLLAAEYLDCYRVHHGLDRIKCVVTDLDATLWPGDVAEDGFGWLSDDVTSTWIHRGLHQALRLLKDRGILLATASKGTRDVTLAAWGEAAPGMALGPDDFVEHLIDWNCKSDNIADLCRRLGLAPEAVLFLDDNPVERAEVRARLPGINVLDGPVHAFRARLLTDARLEVATVTPEAVERTATTRAVLAREEIISRSVDHDTFLRDLDVRATVRDARPDEVDRVAELVNRTTQFTTSGRRTTPAELTRIQAEPDARVLVMLVADRFADYGLVGVLIVERATVDTMVISCRVIGLEVAVPFLVTALHGSGLARPGLRAGVVRTARNEPARDVFDRAGFARVAPDRFALGPGSSLPAVTDGPHQITFQPDRDVPRPDHNRRPA